MGQGGFSRIIIVNGAVHQLCPNDVEGYSLLGHCENARWHYICRIMLDLNLIVIYLILDCEVPVVDCFVLLDNDILPLVARRIVDLLF